MDWGSGFFSEEDAVPIAELAEQCGFEGVREAQRYVILLRRENRWRQLDGPDAMVKARSEIGCQARSSMTKYGSRLCELPEDHEGKHLSGTIEFS